MLTWDRKRNIEPLLFRRDLVPSNIFININKNHTIKSLYESFQIDELLVDWISCKCRKEYQGNPLVKRTMKSPLYVA